MPVRNTHNELLRDCHKNIHGATMKKLKFPLFLTLTMFLLLTAGFVLYIHQRQKHINAEIVKLEESSRVGVNSIISSLSELEKDFAFLNNLGHFEQTLASEHVLPNLLQESFERLFSRFPKVLEKVHIKKNSGQAKVVSLNDVGIIQINDQLKTQQMHAVEGKELHFSPETIFFHIKGAQPDMPDICFELNSENLVSANLISVGKLRQSFRLLLDTEKLNELQTLEFPCYDPNLPTLIEVSHGEKNQTKTEQTLSVSATINGRTEKFFLLLTPGNFGRQSFSLALLLKQDSVLELVNTNHFAFMIFFAFAMIFSFTLVILKFTLNTQSAISGELSTQTDLFSLIINSMPIGVAVKDATDDNRYIICNLAAARIFNLDVDQIIGKTDAEIFSQPILKEHICQDQRLAETLEVEVCEKELANYGAGGIWLRTTRLPIFANDGEVSMLMRVMENITTSVQLESQLHHSQRMDEIGKLAGGIAHEFNNLLQVILGYCEFIRSESDSEAITTNLEQIEKAGKSAMRLTRQLLTYSRKTEMKKEAVNLKNAVSDGLRMLKRFIGDGIEIIFNPASEELVTCADSAQIEQIIVNLCVNARDAMNGKGTINISLARTENVQKVIDLGIKKSKDTPYAHIRVCDNGPGIPETLQQKIFEPFFTTKEVGKGTGLGLAIVYAIMKQHDGYIFIDDSFKNGTAFDIFFPLHVENLKTSENSIALEDKKSLSAGDYVILVAEDEDAVRQMCLKLLHKNGFKTIEASDGEEAVAKFKANQNEISMLIFDVMMPKMTGKAAYEIISAIRPEIPTLFCTGYSDEALKNELTRHKSVMLLDKPYKTAKLIESINTLLASL